MQMTPSYIDTFSILQIKINCKKDIHTLNDWANEWQLKLNVDKCCGIYIYKGELNSAISSTAANRIVARLYT